jgi:putative holliday junction resolvase
MAPPFGAFIFSASPRDLRAACYVPAMRALGLDVGSKTIGVAITDEANIAAHPLVVLEREGTTRDAARVHDLVREHQISDVVIGIPYELSGKIGHRARRVGELASAIREACGPDVAFHEQDERFTTAEAERILIAADVSRARRREVIDRQAAAIILQTWLDSPRAR